MLEPGQLRSQRVLGSLATYRIVELVDEGHVLAEVVSVPGLAAGGRVRLTVAAVEGMALEAAPVDTVDDELQAALRRWAA